MDSASIIAQIITSVFATLTKHVEKKDFCDCRGYRTAEIYISGKKIGIGMCDEEKTLQLFLIDERFHKLVPNRFIPTFWIGVSNAKARHPERWTITLPQEGMCSFNEDLHVLCDHTSHAHEVLQHLEKREKELKKELTAVWDKAT